MAIKKVVISISYEEEGVTQGYKQSLKKQIITDADTGKIIQEIERMQVALTGQQSLLQEEEEETTDEL